MIAVTGCREIRREVGRDMLVVVLLSGRGRDGGGGDVGGRDGSCPPLYSSFHLASVCSSRGWVGGWQHRHAACRRGKINYSLWSA